MASFEQLSLFTCRTVISAYAQVSVLATAVTITRCGGGHHRNCVGITGTCTVPMNSAHTTGTSPVGMMSPALLEMMANKWVLYVNRNLFVQCANSVTVLIRVSLTLGVVGNPVAIAKGPVYGWLNGYKALMSEPGFNGTLVVVDAWRNVLLWRLSETGNLSKVVCNSKWVLAPLPNWGYVYVWRMADDESSASNTVPRVRLLMGPAKKALVVFTDFFGPNICVYVEYWGEPLEVKVTFIDLEKSYRAGRIIEFRPFMLASISISTLGCGVLFPPNSEDVVLVLTTAFTTTLYSMKSHRVLADIKYAARPVICDDTHFCIFNSMAKRFQVFNITEPVCSNYPEPPLCSISMGSHGFLCCSSPEEPFSTAHPPTQTEQQCENGTNLLVSHIPTGTHIATIHFPLTTSNIHFYCTRPCPSGSLY